LLARGVSIELLKQGCSTRVGLRNTLEPDPDNTGVGSFLRTERPSSSTPFAAQAPLFHVNYETKGPHVLSRFHPGHYLIALSPRSPCACVRSFLGLLFRFADLFAAPGPNLSDHANCAASERAESSAAAAEARASHDNCCCPWPGGRQLSSRVSYSGHA
jgi:hypothetical protein